MIAAWSPAQQMLGALLASVLPAAPKPPTGATHRREQCRNCARAAPSLVPVSAVTALRNGRLGGLHTILPGSAFAVGGRAEVTRRPNSFVSDVAHLSRSALHAGADLAQNRRT